MAKEDTGSLRYASYGSNLSRARFMCYIEGGTPMGSSKEEKGCSDRNPPKGDELVKIKHSLYFSEHGARWSNKGVAFINQQEDVTDDGSATLGRMYLITRDQFIDVVKQENGLDSVDIDFAEVKARGSSVFRESWYGNILYLGDHEGNPIFTFTTYKKKEVMELVAPSPEYLRVIASGLNESWGLGKDEIADYLIQKEGIRGNFSEKELIGFQ